MPSEQADVPWRLNGVRKAVNVAAVVVAALMGAASISTAVPPPAPNPSDSEIGSGRRAAEADDPARPGRVNERSRVVPAPATRPGTSSLL